MPFNIRADGVSDGSVGIDVVGSVLGIILDDENGHRFPELTFGKPFDNPPQCQIIIRDVGGWRGTSRLGTRRVVIWQSHDNQSGKFPLLFEFGKFRQEAIGSQNIRIVEVITAKQRIKMTFQGFDCRGSWIGKGGPVADEFAVTAISDPLFGCPIPEIATKWSSNFQRPF